MEVEEMINKVREEQGRPFDMKQLTASCVANVVMNMMFGHRFDHSDPAYQQLISNFNELTANASIALELFPALRFLPYFKKNLAKDLQNAKKAYAFINSNIATCTVVCNNSFHDVVIQLACTRFIGGVLCDIINRQKKYGRAAMAIRFSRGFKIV